MSGYRQDVWYEETIEELRRHNERLLELLADTPVTGPALANREEMLAKVKEIAEEFDIDPTLEAIQEAMRKHVPRPQSSLFAALRDKGGFLLLNPQGKWDEGGQRTYFCEDAFDQLDFLPGVEANWDDMTFTHEGRTFDWETEQRVDLFEQAERTIFNVEHSCLKLLYIDGSGDLVEVTHNYYD